MFHRHRTWCLTPVGTPEELARMLTQQTWTLCSAFYVKDHPDYLFLNDSTHEDGAGEWAVVKRQGGRLFQVESITFSWCRYPAALGHITDALAGRDDDQAQPVTATIETPEQHGRCCHCA